MNNNMSVGQNISLHVTDQYEWKSVVNELLQRSAVVRVTLRVCEIRGNQISESSIHFAAKPVLYLTAHAGYFCLEQFQRISISGDLTGTQELLYRPNWLIRQSLLLAYLYHLISHNL